MAARPTSHCPSPALNVICSVVAPLGWFRGLMIGSGLDAGVKDGVDIFSISIGSQYTPLDQDVVAIGSFAAVKKGIFVSCDAGNDVPDNFTLANEAPCVLNVAASRVDRRFRASVKLPNGKVYEAHNKLPKDVATFVKSHDANALIFIAPKLEGATVIITELDFPGIWLASQDGSNLIYYLISSSDPSASIVFDGTDLGISPTLVVAYFSSWGPSRAMPGILKPDISGPGLNILEGWISSNDTPGYAIRSGTSLSTPHLSDVATLLKATHPTWSLAAIKSAFVTTADANMFDERRLRLLHLRQIRQKGTRNMARGVVDCSKSMTEEKLNYPSILVALKVRATTKVSRTVTNVGPTRSSYTISVTVSKTFMSATITLKILTFTKLNEQKSFTVRGEWGVDGPSTSDIKFVEGKLTWTSDDGKHVVTSSLVISAPK
ncbi:subtilisin-like protease SBT1.5 [Zingiber officinale]|uniref:subtilisin-like protease SBT1.5 n=1 Tax=Zingiber officinale TaxID=94328 RepID=UPI001C4D4786|nr:subtilisin-like protease SBT1.5 [Zingiber officinale]